MRVASPAAQLDIPASGHAKAVQKPCQSEVPSAPVPVLSQLEPGRRQALVSSCTSDGRAEGLSFTLCFVPLVSLKHAAVIVIWGPLGVQTGHKKLYKQLRQRT